MVSEFGTDFMAGGGEMGALMRARDWATTSLGSPRNWPQSLRLTIRLMLNSNHPMFIWWGPDLVQFYNDAYMETMGPEMHPAALGARGRESWSDIWDIIGGQIEQVMEGRGATWNVDALVPIRRNGRREDVWWTYGYSPIDLEGEIGGVLVVCNDVTSQHLANAALQTQTQRVEALFEQAPGCMAVLRGPDHIIELANAAFRRLVGGRDLVGHSLAKALPEIAGQGMLERLDQVLASGDAQIGRREPLTLLNSAEVPQTVYLDFVYQPIRESRNVVTGIFIEGIDVTLHVRAEEHLRLVNDELKHRVKNTLAMVSAIAAQTLRGTGNNAELTAFFDRLATFGKAHDTLTANAWATASVPEVVGMALAMHRTGRGQFSVEGGEIEIGSKQALSLALAVHELATNATKYGALTQDSGRVQVRWGEEDVAGTPSFVFDWQESGGPVVRSPAKRGFGSKLIERVLTADFGGAVDLDFHPGGVHCRLVAPRSHLSNILPSPFASLDA